jgi:hypothetical protein
MLRLVAVLALIAALLLIVRSTRKARGPIERNRIFASDVWSGQFPYDPHPELGYERPVHAPYPPSYGVVMGWQLLAPTTVIRVIWATLQMLLLVVLFVHLGKWWRCTVGTRGPPLWVIALSILLVSRYLLRDTAGGGGNLVFGTLVALACLRPGEAHGEDKRAWTGILLGIVLAAKPTPIFFVPWLLLRGRYRTLAVAALTALALHATPLLTMGTETWLASYQRWFEGAWLFSTQSDAFAPAAHGFPGFEHNQWMHQSLRFFVARFFGQVPDAATLDTPLFFGGLGLPVWEVAGLTRILSLSLLGLTLFGAWLRRRDESGWGEGLAFASLVCLTNLISPIVWKSYWVQAIPVFFVFLTAIAERPRESRRLEILLLLYFFGCVLLSGDIVGKDNKELLESLYVVTIFGIGLWVACIYLILRMPVSRARITMSRSDPGASSTAAGSSAK